MNPSGSTTANPSRSPSPERIIIGSLSAAAEAWRLAATNKSTLGTDRTEEPARTVETDTYFIIEEPDGVAEVVRFPFATIFRAPSGITPAEPSTLDLPPYLILDTAIDE